MIIVSYLFYYFNGLKFFIVEGGVEKEDIWYILFYIDLLIVNENGILMK